MAYNSKQRKIDGSVKGANQLIKELKDMGDGAKNILILATKEGGNIALQDAIDHCPVDTGALKNSLRLKISKQSETKAEVTVEYDKSIRYGTFVELGAKGKPPNPFLRNAIDNNVKQINDAITNAVRNGVNKRK